MQLYKEQQMRRRINNLIQKTPFKSYTSFFNDVVKDKQRFADFIEYLTINVSEFFRNKENQAKNQIPVSLHIEEQCGEHPEGQGYQIPG